MKVFISWSGETSRQVAIELRRWLPDIFQAIDPWMSEVDINAGSRWNNEISTELEQTSVGIICLTKENQNSPWLLFETGALAKSMSDVFVCPYMIDLDPADIIQGPLTQFQAKKANKLGTWELVCMLNNVLKDISLSDEKLKRTFEKWWPDFNQKLDSILKSDRHLIRENPVRTDREVLDEILELTRNLTIQVKSIQSSSKVDKQESPKPRQHPKNIDSKTLLETGNFDEFIDGSRR